ncbi:hypothetical protein GQ55_4G326600 [Panicum hallii var. hallii]|uniref:Myb-like domain-containing protein n=1 Tax=Panicum hallii var. hallii TaxID=1504633 RepID=A0A2T7E2K9_9POAL|nr:hypothetical protein GQ55_4G326600 [Panicum hallii var. hallii]
MELPKHISCRFSPKNTFAPPRPASRATTSFHISRTPRSSSSPPPERFPGRSGQDGAAPGRPHRILPLASVSPRSQVFQDVEGHGAYYTNLMNEGTYNENYEDILDTPTEFRQTPPIKDNNPSSKATRKQKGKNFTEEEDRLLVSAWLNVSTDATQGTNKKYCTSWKRIYMFYETNKGDIAGRSQNSLMHRWNVIQEIVSRFCGTLS